MIEYREYIGKIRMLMSLECVAPKTYFESTDEKTTTNMSIKFVPPKYARKDAVALLRKVLGI